MGRVKIELDGTRFRQARERLDLSVEDLAAKLDLEPHVVSAIEKGHRALTTRQASQLHQRIQVLERARMRATIPQMRPNEFGPTGKAVSNVAD